MTTHDLFGQITSFTLEATMLVCGECGIPFSVPSNYYNKLKETGQGWYCPNGHSRVFSKPEIPELKRRLQEKENQLMQKITENIQLDNQLTKANKKLKKVQEGKCPCCEKTYKHLAVHMKNKHPNQC